MSFTSHKDLVVGHIHLAYNWSYADAAARTAATGFVAGDVGKIARQVDTNTLWMLTATTPTWVQVGGTGLTPATHASTHQVGGSDAFTGIVPASAFAPSGLTGAVAASRYVGATASGAPTAGTFAVGDYVLDQTGKLWVCTAAGTPGTWTQVGAGASGAWTVIADTVLAAVAASVTFSSIPATYRHLAIIWSSRNDTGASTVLLRCNGDTTANYDGVIIDVFGTTTAVVTTAAGTSIRVGSMASPTGGWSGGVIELFDYASTATGRDKTALARASRKDSNASPDIYLEHTSGWWRTTATAITSLTLLPGANNFAINSKFTLYGISA